MVVPPWSGMHSISTNNFDAYQLKFRFFWLCDTIVIRTCQNNWPWLTCHPKMWQKRLQTYCWRFQSSNLLPGPYTICHVMFWWLLHTHQGMKSIDASLDTNFIDTHNSKSISYDVCMVSYITLACGTHFSSLGHSALCQVFKDGRQSRIHTAGSVLSTETSHHLKSAQGVLKRPRETQSLNAMFCVCHYSKLFTRICTLWLLGWSFPAQGMSCQGDQKQHHPMHWGE